MKTKERRCIVVDEDNHPMTYQDTQFCYNYKLGRSRFYLRTYTFKEARKLIEKTVNYRISKGFDTGEYYLMPLAK